MTRDEILEALKPWTNLQGNTENVSVDDAPDCEPIRIEYHAPKLTFADLRALRRVYAALSAQPAKEPSEEALDKALGAYEKENKNSRYNAVKSALRAAYAIDFAPPPPEPNKEASSTAWPAFCVKPNSCARHKACMYNCGKSSAGEIKSAIQSRPSSKTASRRFTAIRHHSLWLHVVNHRIDPLDQALVNHIVDMCENSISQAPPSPEPSEEAPSFQAIHEMVEEAHRAGFKAAKERAAEEIVRYAPEHDELADNILAMEDE